MSEDKQNTQDTRSEIEKMYDATALKFGVQRKFSELHPMEVQVLCQAATMVMQVVRDV